MIIQSSNVGMNAKRSYASSSMSYASLVTWDRVKSSAITNVTINNSDDESSNSDSKSSNNNFQDSMDDILSRFKATQNISGSSIPNAHSSSCKIQFQSLNYLLLLLFGGKFNLLDDSSASARASYSSSQEQEAGGSYQSTYSFNESECTSYNATGTAQTTDGKEIDFNLSLTMSRSFSEYFSEQIDFGSPLLTDPLVINVGSDVANVTDQKFFFDIDSDGNLNEISTLGSGSGYLALDKNEDGIINDGNELFGTKNGDGFSDLAQYDSDGNGWIDEADSIFNQLKVWTKDADGNDSLTAIGKAGIGAIYLGSADTQFSINSSSSNTTNAVIRKSGIFLYENGMAGTIQHVDMANTTEITA